MMDSMQQGILRMVYSAVSGEVMSLPGDFDLEQALPLIKKHQLGNLIYYGAVNCGMDSKSPVMQELFSITYKSMIVDERQRAELQKLMSAFDANRIHYMPVKGVLMKALYPKPDMRIMGDADILIKLDQYDRIRPLMLELGYVEKLESDHELIWQKPSLYLELHKRLIPSYNYDYAAYYGDGWQLGRPCEDNPCRYEMTDEDQMIYLFTHFAKHYRDGGIGVRHMLDLYLYRKAKPNLDLQYMTRELEKLQLNSFFENIYRTLAVWFDGAQDDELTEQITAFIFRSGAYGAHDTHQIAQGIRDKANEGGSTKQVKRRAWLRLIFLPYGSMCEKYPVLRKAPVLLPIMWVVRWFTALFKNPKNISVQRKRVQLLSEEKLDAWESQMQAVGLGFHFEEKEQ